MGIIRICGLRAAVSLLRASDTIRRFAANALPFYSFHRDLVHYYYNATINFPHNSESIAFSISIES